MKTLFCLAAPWMAALAVLSVDRPAGAHAPRPAAVIVTPKRNELVSREAELFAKLLLPGQPVVLVREDQPGSLWYVQDTGQPTDGKVFRNRITFGSDSTPQGRRFFVMVVLMRNAQELEIFQPRTAIDNIPWDMPRSAQIPVVLDRREKPPPQTKLIVRPTPGSKVSQMEDLVAVVDDGTSVVAMVRSNEVDSYWWVQDIVENAHGGKITATVRFGNQSTQPGTRFSVVLLLPTSAKDLQQFHVGDYMRHLPDHVRKSKEVQVILR